MFACIYVPNFPVAAALRTEPELQARPVAIFEGKPPLEQIIAVNEKARDAGIFPGMTKAQAELCPSLTLRPRSPLLESSAHAALLDCAQSFSPVVEETAQDTILLDLAGLESLFGSFTKISHAIFDRAKELGVKANVATAVNPDAALLGARGLAVAPGEAENRKILVIPPGKEAERLGQFPIEVLFDNHLEGEQKEEAARMRETLDRWGIRTLRALAALPEISLTERLGQQGLQLQKLARGAHARTLVPVEPPLIFEEAIELEDPIVLLEPLAFLLNRLLEQICARLATRALATQELRLILELSNLTGVEDEFDNGGIPSECSDSSNDSTKNMWEQPPSKPALSDPEERGGVERVRWSEAPQLSRRSTQFIRKLSLPLPMLDAKVFLKLLQLDLNAHPPGAPIVKIHLAAEPARLRSAQGGLFLPPAPEPEKLELTLARIAGIVGEQRVGAIELLDTHHPEGFRMRRFVAEVARKTPQKNTRDTAEAHVAITALRRFRPPLGANVTLQNSQPVRLICPTKREVQGDVLWKAGPWRFSGDWWERDAWSRDEWDLAVRNGESVAFYRLVHDLLGGGWFVEGTYD